MIEPRRVTRCRLLVALVAVAAAVVGLAGCSSGGGSTSASAPQATAPVTPSVSCPAPLTTTKPGAEMTVTSGADERTYNVWLPAEYTGTEPVPLIVDYHGTGGKALSYEEFSSMGAQAPPRGYLLVAPQAVVGDASGIGWKSPGSGTTPDDVQFTADLLKDVASKYCVDPARRYATGFSSGAAFTTYVSCTLDVWAAVAPMSGANLVQPCVGRPAVPVVTFHGTNDTYVAYASSVPASLPDPKAFYFGDMKTVMTQWAARNGCGTTPTDTPVVPTVTLRTYAGCPAGKDVAFYTIEGTGHTYPGGKPVSKDSAEELGGQSQAIDAGKVLLDFFDTHKRTTPPVETPAAWAPAAAPSGAATAPASGAAGASSTALPTITLPAS